MKFVWFSIAWGVGCVVGGVFLLQPLIVFFFGLPFSLKLKRNGILQSNTPLVMYIGSMILLFALFAGSTYVMHHWFPKYVTGYWIGVGIVAFLGMGKLGVNETNISEYVQINGRYLDKNRLRDEMGIDITKE